MKILATILIALVLACACMAQTPTPTPAPTPDAPQVHFVENNAFYQMTDGKTATVFSAAVPVTKNFSGVFSQWFVPDVNGNISMAGIEYERNLGDLVKSGINPELKLIRLFGRAQLGSEIDSNNTRNFAYSLEAGFDFPVGTMAGGTILTGASIGFLGLPYEGEHYVLGSGGTISPHVKFSF